MNFTTFPVGATNIFPLANSTVGGQLLTEFNLRSRESIATPPEVEYMIGPSYCHSMRDYHISVQTDTSGNAISSSVIQVSAGRALVNGHYVETLAPMIVDLNEANLKLKDNNKDALKGELVIGIRAMYSTLPTMAAAMLVENSETDLYEGVQLVILPPSEFKLPTDVPGKGQENKVTAHLKLGTFNFTNGQITNVEDNPDKCKYISAERVSAGDSDIMDSIYVTKTGLDPKKLYVYAGYKYDSATQTGEANWCDALESLMVWDSHPNLQTGRNPSDLQEAAFIYDESLDKIKLQIPHKQVDSMESTSGQPQYYADKEITLPNADYDTGVPGMVSRRFIQHIKSIDTQVKDMYRLPGGTFRGYIPYLDDRANLPIFPKLDTSGIPEYIPPIVPIQEYVARLNEVAANLELLQSRLDAVMRSTINEVVDPTTDELQRSIDGIRDDLANLLERIITLEAAETSGQAVAEQIAALRRDVTQLQSNYRALNNKVTTLEATLRGRIDDAIAEVDAELRSKITLDLAAISNRMDTELRLIAEKYNVAKEWQWRAGDYVIVGQDATVGTTVDGRLPSTIYVVQPGQIRAIARVSPNIVKSVSTRNPDEYAKDYAEMRRSVPPALVGGCMLSEYMLSSREDLSSQMTADGTYWNVQSYRGNIEKDYFVARLREEDPAVKVEIWTSVFYTPTAWDTSMEWSDPMWLTGGVPLASEEAIGGFFNVPANALGSGYVHLDETGHLRLLDWDILSDELAAYHLSENFKTPSGIVFEEIQATLDEYVNERVAFPNLKHKEDAISKGANPQVINVEIDLTGASPNEDGSVTVLKVHDIDSRFGASVNLIIKGNPAAPVILSITNCAKLRVTVTSTSGVYLAIDNCNLYYDPQLLNMLASSGNGVDNMKLWYEKFEDTDPDLLVDGMTVELAGEPIPTSNEDYWATFAPNDNHYSYALRSITFSPTGEIIRCGLLVTDGITSNVETGNYASVFEFTLPQTPSFTYPEYALKKPLKVTGGFVTAYPTTSPKGYLMKDTKFTAITNAYISNSTDEYLQGNIAFYTNAAQVNSISWNVPGSSESIDAWQTGKFHIFYGGITE